MVREVTVVIRKVAVVVREVTVVRIVTVVVRVVAMVVREVTLVVREVTLVVREVTMVVREVTVVIRKVTMVVREVTVVIRKVTMVVREATVGVGKVMAITRLLAAVVREVNTVLRVFIVVLEDETEAAEVRCGSGGLRSPSLTTPTTLTVSPLCLNVQVRATHPSPTHPHRLPGLEHAGTPDVNVHAMWRETVVCTTSVGGPMLISTGPSRPGVAGQHGATTQRTSHKEYLDGWLVRVFCVPC